MSHEPTGQTPRPTNNVPNAWRAYWESQGMPWRIEPAIDDERQAYLRARRAVRPDTRQGIYPFRDENGSIRLTRADLEWLLATHESDGFTGPVDWTDERQRSREGLDVRGADLHHLRLQHMPLSCLRSGSDFAEYSTLYAEPAAQASVHLEDADLTGAHLEGAFLGEARLERAMLSEAHIEHAELFWVHLERAVLWRAHLEGSNLY